MQELDEEDCLGLGGEQGGVGHNDEAAHNRMNATLIGISARRKVRDRVGASRVDGAGIKGATAAVKASIVRDRMVGRRGIIPSNSRTGGHGDGSGNVIRRTTIHEDLGRRGSGRGGPSC